MLYTFCPSCFKKLVVLQAVLESHSTTGAATEATVLSIEGDERKKLKPPRLVLQKLAPSDDIESFIDMFERVAIQQGWSMDVWATQLA